mmetsp:Transcript_10914/g.38321  ORF Transcript_10914/g.38321 Transcript_10914/m.38321 type:complete len:502 (+) Transcript_10914:1322-2827(+)
MPIGLVFFFWQPGMMPLQTPPAQTLLGKMSAKSAPPSPVPKLNSFSGFDDQSGASERLPMDWPSLRPGITKLCKWWIISIPAPMPYSKSFSVQALASSAASFCLTFSLYCPELPPSFSCVEPNSESCNLRSAANLRPAPGVEPEAVPTTIGTETIMCGKPNKPSVQYTSTTNSPSNDFGKVTWELKTHCEAPALYRCKFADGADMVQVSWIVVFQAVGTKPPSGFTWKAVKLNSMGLVVFRWCVVHWRVYAVPGATSSASYGLTQKADLVTGTTYTEMSISATTVEVAEGSYIDTDTGTVSTWMPMVAPVLAGTCSAESQAIAGKMPVPTTTPSITKSIEVSKRANVAALVAVRLGIFQLSKYCGPISRMVLLESDGEDAFASKTGIVNVLPFLRNKSSAEAMEVGELSSLTTLGAMIATLGNLKLTAFILDSSTFKALSCQTMVRCTMTVWPSTCIVTSVGEGSQMPFTVLEHMIVLVATGVVIPSSMIATCTGTPKILS